MAEGSRGASESDTPGGRFLTTAFGQQHEPADAPVNAPEKKRVRTAAKVQRSRPIKK
jgi:hypothetical protein